MKKAKKTFISLISVLFILLTGYGLVIFGLIWKSSKAVPSKSSDTLIILGAQVKGATKETAYPSQSLRERLDTAITYWQEYPKMKIIVSGGKGADEPDTEANVMANYLIDKGIPEKQIIREEKSTNTSENLRFSQKLHSLSNAIVVTNDFHIYRARLLGKRMNLNLQGLAAPTRNASKYYSWLRETLALGYTVLFK